MVAPVSLLRFGLCALCLAAPFSRGSASGAADRTVTSPVGTIHLLRPDGSPKGLVVYLTGRHGWDKRAAATAWSIAELDYLVAGVRLHEPAPGYRPKNAACWDVAQDVGRVIDAVRREDAPLAPTAPVLLGDREGASIAYAALAEAPPNTFHAALGLSFCPAWDPPRPPCSIGGFSGDLLLGGALQPAARVPNAWFVFPPEQGADCPVGDIKHFVERVDNALWVSIRNGTPGARPVREMRLTQILQWLDPRIPYQIRANAEHGEIRGVPLTEVRSTAPDTGTLAIMLSGDGGWAVLDRGIAAAFASRGISTVGWDSLTYYWRARTPGEASADLARVIRHYLKTWGAQRVLLVGYSFGAEVLPFLVAGLPPDLHRRVALVALWAPGQTAVFELRLTDWLRARRDREAVPLLPAVESIGWVKRLCIYGAKEADSGCPGMTGAGVRVRRVPGGHHFDEDYSGLAGLIISNLGDAQQKMP